MRVRVLDLDAVAKARFPAELEEAPDHIWLVDSTDNPPSVMISKDGPPVGAAVGEQFLPYLLGSVGPEASR